MPTAVGPPKSQRQAIGHPTLRGRRSDPRCHLIGTSLAIGLLGGVLFGHSDEQVTDEQAAGERATEGIELLQALAARGSAVAACGLGMCLMDGHGVDVDEEQAVSFCFQSAEAGYQHGQHALGCAFYLGTGVEADTSQAVRWFERAAAQGHPNAMFMLGEILLDGAATGAPGREVAYHWLMKAGELGHVGARARVRCGLLGMPFSPGFELLV